MLARCARYCVLLLLIVCIGGGWVFLQAVAWVGMIVDYSRGHTFAVAICQTFDGRHPCCLCKAIANGKRSEEKKSWSAQNQKLEFPPLERPVTMDGAAHYPGYSSAASAAIATFPRPPTPPPRPLFV